MGDIQRDEQHINRLIYNQQMLAGMQNDLVDAMRKVKQASRVHKAAEKELNEAVLRMCKPIHEELYAVIINATSHTEGGS